MHGKVLLAIIGVGSGIIGIRDLASQDHDLGSVQYSTLTMYYVLLPSLCSIKDCEPINHQSSSLKNSIQNAGFGCNDLLGLLEDPTISGVQSVRTEQSL